LEQTINSNSDEKIEIFNTFFLKHIGYQFCSKRLDERRKEQIDFIKGYVYEKELKKMRLGK